MAVHASIDTGKAFWVARRDIIQFGRQANLCKITTKCLSSGLAMRASHQSQD